MVLFFFCHGTSTRTWRVTIGSPSSTPSWDKDRNDYSDRWHTYSLGVWRLHWKRREENLNLPFEKTAKAMGKSTPIIWISHCRWKTVSRVSPDCIKSTRTKWAGQAARMGLSYFQAQCSKCTVRIQGLVFRLSWQIRDVQKAPSAVFSIISHSLSILTPNINK